MELLHLDGRAFGFSVAFSRAIEIFLGVDKCVQ